VLKQGGGCSLEGNIMGLSISLGRIWGVPIKLHVSWFLIFTLITWTLAIGYFPTTYPTLAPNLYWILGAITSVLFAVSVLLHELGHVAVALRNKIPVKGVMLFIFGGVAELEEEPKSPGAEFRISIAGPAVSLGLAGFFYVLWMLDRSIPVLAAPSEYLFRINLILALFNMIPGFPLDGGRVLRALVWQLTGSAHRATRFASSSGQIIALGFIAVGIFVVIQGNLFNGVWLAFIGWFLQNAAVSARNYSSLQRLLAGARVEQLMRRDFERVPSLLPLDELVTDHVIYGGRQAFLVSDNENPRGIITLNEINAVPQRKWPFTTTSKAMLPIDRMSSVNPEMELLAALHKMEDARLLQMPVMARGEVVGLLSREDILHYVQTRAKLGV
jgi:Zn-dependent protease